MLADVDPALLHLTTQRLVIRPWERDDLTAMMAWSSYTDPLNQLWSWARSIDRTVSMDLFFGIHSADPTRRVWTILVDNHVAGLLQLKQTHLVGDAALGIALGNNWIDQGYGREALGAVLDAFFGPWGFRSMRLEVAIANRRALHLYTAFGFRETKRFWRDIDPELDLSFLDTPVYADVRPYFRWANQGVYQLCAEMQRTAADP